MGTPLSPKHIPYTYMDPLGKVYPDNQSSRRSRLGAPFERLSKLPKGGYIGDYMGYYDRGY